MAYAQQRRALSGPALTHILARLTDADVSTSTQPLSDRLSQRLSWTDAITLSSALGAVPPVGASGIRPGGSDTETITAHVHAASARSIASNCAPDARPGPRVSIQGPLASVIVGYVDLRQCYALVQQTIELEIGGLRDCLQRLLVVRTPDLACLAVLDVNMKQTLAGRERSLLGVIPTTLARYFECLRTTEQRRQAELPAEGQATPSTSRAWLDASRRDIQSVLLAELDVRFQPVGGSLAALRLR